MIVEMVACHYANRSGRGQAAAFVTRDVARELVEAGQAVWSKGAKYLNFTKTEAEVHRAAQSLTMSARVTEQAAQGSAYHMSLVNGWRPLMRAA
jgi:hypothetical protein